MFRINHHLLFSLVLLLVASAAGAQKKDPSVTLDDLYQMLQKQQKLIESQQATIDALSARLDSVAPEKPSTVDTDPPPPPTGSLALDPQDTSSVDQQRAEKKRSTRGMPADVITAGEFPGSMWVPNTFGDRERTKMVALERPISCRSW